MTVATDNNLKRVYQLGQSPWYDNIDRRIIDNGELKFLFDSGITGVTSNPTIFEKAINGSFVYDDKINNLKKKGAGIEAIYDELTADDVRDAADLLKGVYESTKGLDGYVSIEVLPSYASDPVKTVEYARHIYKKVARPNIMIKVPGTKESPEAIKALIREGINVNITLLFSVSQYELIARAYIEGLEERLKDGNDISRVFSVASVFISRIDTKVDSLLDALAQKENVVAAKQRFYFLKGKVAVSNAKFIYQKFRDIFLLDGFEHLKSKGGNVQRPLWASTGTKNPSYSDVIYVDSLIGPMTVNTMPHSTVEAFLNHGVAGLTIEEDLEGAGVYLSTLEGFGINLDTVCNETQAEGVRAFVNSFETLMSSLKNKMK